MSVYLFKPDEYSSHMKIIDYLKKTGKRLKILDIGCSKGFMGKELGRKHDFYGVELSKEDSLIAKKYYKEIKILNVDTEKPTYPEKFFDVIIMADVIEHLKDPLGVLSHFKKFLKKTGLIILSVPNVANAYVRLKLLFGNFDYEEKGILDSTHLKFYTLKSIRKLVENAKLQIESEDFTPIPLPTMNPAFSHGRFLNFIHKINYFFAFAFKKMFAFQFIIYCRIKE